MHLTPRKYGLIAGAVSLLAIAGCGSSAKVNTTMPPNVGLTIIAKDNIFDAKTYTAKSGDVVIAYDNKGATGHNLRIEGVTGFKLDAAPGEISVGTAKLIKGTYVMYCNLPGHRDSGMQATLIVG